MIRPEGFDPIADSTRSVVKLVNDSLTGHARQASDLASRSMDPNNDIDPVEELTRFWTRTIRDGARLFRAMWTMVDLLGQDPKGPILGKVEAPPNPNPVETKIGPVATMGGCKSDGLRRRGDAVTTIAAGLIKVTRNPVDASRLDVVVEAGGAPRGLYEGTMTVGAGATKRETPYNIYVDW